MQYKYIVFDHDGTLVDPRNLEIFNGIKDLLATLSEKGAKLYVWTSRNRFSTVEVLKSSGVIHLFEELSTCTDCENKPSTAGLIAMLDNVPKDQVVIIGDSSTDMIGANNYKVKGLGANWLERSTEAAEILTYFGADQVFSSIDDLKQFLIK